MSTTADGFVNTTTEKMEKKKRGAGGKRSLYESNLMHEVAKDTFRASQLKALRENAKRIRVHGIHSRMEEFCDLANVAEGISPEHVEDGYFMEFSIGFGNTTRQTIRVRGKRHKMGSIARSVSVASASSDDAASQQTTPLSNNNNARGGGDAVCSQRTDFPECFSAFEQPVNTEGDFAFVGSGLHQEYSPPPSPPSFLGQWCGDFNEEEDNDEQQK